MKASDSNLVFFYSKIIRIPHQIAANPNNHLQETRATMFSLKAVFSVLLIASAAAVSGSAFAHAAIKESSPPASATLDTPPKEVVLVFNEKLEGAFSSIKVLDKAGKEVPSSKARVDASDPTKLHLDVPTLGSGAYTVRWTAVGPDGHPRKGDYTFTVK